MPWDDSTGHSVYILGSRKNIIEGSINLNSGKKVKDIHFWFLLNSLFPICPFIRGLGNTSRNVYTDYSLFGVQ